MVLLARRICWPLALCLLSILAAPTARGGTVLHVRDRDLAATADAIVTGTVRTLESVASPDGVRIRTFVTLAVEEVLAGGLQVDEITLVEPGGRIGAREQRIFGAPSYQVGEPVLVFLEQRPDGSFRTAHLSLGKFALVWDQGRQEAVAVRDLGATRVLSSDALGRLVVKRDPRRPVARFLRHLRRWVRRSRPLTVSPVTSADLLADPGDERRVVARFTRLGNARWFEPDAGLPVFFSLAGADPALGVDASWEAVRSAYSTWSQVDTAQIVLEDGGSAPPRSISQCDRESHLTFDDPFDEITDPSGCGGVLAVGGYCSNGDATVIGGVVYTRIFEGDVTFNNGFEDCVFWTPTNVAEVVTHELGHTIGLGHSSARSPEPDVVLQDATMYFMAHFDGRGAALRADDIAGVSAIYPVSDATAPPPPDLDSPPDPDPPPDPNPPPDPDPPPADPDPTPPPADPAPDPCGNTDSDGDGVADDCDNCSLFPNPLQSADEACVGMSKAEIVFRFGGLWDSGMDRFSLRAILPPAARDSLSASVTATLSVVAEDEILYEAHIPAGSLEATGGGTRFSYLGDTGEQVPGLVKLLLAPRLGGDVRLLVLAQDLNLGAGKPDSVLIRFRLGEDTFVTAVECSGGKSPLPRRLRCG